jgi:hypothetical protein
MYGHISWNSTDGNVVTFRIEAGYRRSILSSFWQNGQAQVGDILVLGDVGIGTTAFNFGDGVMTDNLQMRVTAYSALEDWIIGEFYLVHQYATPSDSGRNWVASLSGCCRMESLAVQKDSDFTLSAYVNLLQSDHSPVVRSLPLQTAYMQTNSFGQVQLSNVLVNADDPDGSREIAWTITPPWDVGTSANFTASRGSFASISLNGFYASSNSGCSDKNGIDPSCLFALLRTDPNQVDNALTVEGWVRARAPGHVLAVGPDRCFNSGGTCQPGASAPACPVSTSTFQSCAISTLSVTGPSYLVRDGGREGGREVGREGGREMGKEGERMTINWEGGDPNHTPQSWRDAERGKRAPRKGRLRGREGTREG